MSTETSTRGPRRPWAGAGWCVLGGVALLLLALGAYTHVWVLVGVSLLVLVVAGIRAWGSFTGIHHVGKAKVKTAA